MFSHFLHAWVWSGVDLNQTNINCIKLTNSVALVACTVLIMQLPLVLVYLHPQGLSKLVALSAIITALFSVPLLNKFGHTGHARMLLISGYGIYICASSLVVGYNLNHHYFLLLGMFVCPFLFRKEEESVVWCSVAVFAAGFISIDFYWRFAFLQSAYKATFETILSSSNALFFTLSSIWCSFHIRKNTNASWWRLHKTHSANSELLYKTLPRHLVEKLKTSHQEHREHIDDAAILFVDIVGYSEMCAQSTKGDSTNVLLSLFTEFDTLVKNHNLSKIKTNGDEYMVAAGLTGEAKCSQRPGHRCCHLALAMQKCLNNLNARDGSRLTMRTGIASGPVVAGVMGTMPLRYDVWGDTVNRASRLENSADKNAIQVCENTYLQARDALPFVARGEIKLKGIGKLNSYWLVDDVF